MRAFHVVELLDYDDFLYREAYDPFTIYYWPIPPIQPSEENETPWSPIRTVSLGGAVTLDTGEPLMLMSPGLVQEMVERQGFHKGDDGGGGVTPGPEKKQVLIFDSFGGVGPIKDQLIEDCFIEGSEWNSTSYGTVVYQDGVSWLEGPLALRIAWGDGNSLVSEPLKFEIVLREGHGQFTEDDPMLEFTNSFTGGQSVKMYGNADTGNITIETNRSWGAASVNKKSTFSAVGSGLNGAQFTILVYPTSIQVTCGDMIHHHGDFDMSSMPSLSGFSLTANTGIQLLSLKAERIRYVAAQ